MTGSITGWAGLFVKRLVFGMKINRICKKKGFMLKKKGFLWWLGRNKSGKCNFTVICGDESYCVKLVGVRSKRILYGFVDDNSYEIKDYTFALPVSMYGFEYKIKKKEPYQFEKGTIPCIVMIPHSVKVTMQCQTHRIEIGNGDKIPEGEFFFAEKFLNMLKQK